MSMKKIFNLKGLVVASIILSIFTFSFSCTYASSDSQMKHIQVTEAEISKLDDTVDKRTEALIKGDYEQYEILDNKIKNMGVDEITISDLSMLTGDNISLTGSGTNNIKYEKSTYTTYSSGKTYQIMKITATPYDGESILYNTGNTTIKNASSSAATSMKLVKIAIDSVIGEASDGISVVQTVYDALKSSVSLLKSTSTITSIKAVYTWNTAETCTFIYVYDDSLESYRLSGRYHKLSSGLGISIPTLKTSNDGSIASVQQKSYSGTATPVNYGSLSKAIEYFKKNAVYTSSITDITIKGIENKAVKKITLANPQTPLAAGYK